MQADTERARGVRPFVFTDLLRRIGVDEVVRFIEQAGGLKAGECCQVGVSGPWH
jgi:urease accessory protein